MEPKQERVASVNVDVGLFVLRYVSSTAPLPPRLFVHVSPSSEGAVQLLFKPGAIKNLLTKPKEYVVVAAEKPGSLHLTVSASAGGGDDAHVMLEPLDAFVFPEAERAHAAAPPKRRTSPAPERAVASIAQAGRRRGALTQPEARSSPRSISKVEPRSGTSLQTDKSNGLKSVHGTHAFFFVCHVARRGDIKVEGGSWIGGPNTPAIIEGVTIHWSAPTGMALEYQVLVKGSEGRWSAWVLSGEFAGSRGCGLPLVGLRIRLIGSIQKTFRLSGEAIFLGLPAVVETGVELEFTNYAGVDPLVGLKLDLLALSDGAEASPPDKPMAVKEPVKDGNEERRLRIFKSSRASQKNDLKII